MTPAAYLLLDQGGHGSRALLMDEAGRQLAEADAAVATREDNGDRVEQDGAEIVASLRRCIAGIRAQYPGKSITAAGLAVQRGSVLCWDRDSGKPLTAVLSWRDRRRPERQGPAPGQVRERTGLRYSPYGGAPKLRWCLESEPQVARAAAAGRLAMGPLASFLLRALLEPDTHLIDPGLAQRSLLWSRQVGDWDPVLLEAFGLDRRWLPRVCPSHHDYGQLRDLAGAVPLGLLMGDQNAVPWLAGSPRADTSYLNLGTGGFMLRPVAADQDPGPFQFTLLEPTLPTPYALEASLHGVGAALDWLSRRLDKAIGPAQIRQSLREPGNAPLFINSVGGLGSPWWQAGPSPDFLSPDGVSVIPDPEPQAALAGVLESICFLIRENLDDMDELAGQSERLLLSGGLSRSDEFCALIAAFLNRPVSRLVGGEATATGLWWRLRGADGPGPEVARVAADPGPWDLQAMERRWRVWRRCMPDVAAD
ncbi:FGGY family carbohydrate kinase [Gammaproteobacteria bacterium AB-CW1]|uniref:FGGY family carbohydrate kinase n=1 Tax=Natronospira elongata TaxID=3110268 RepID=A0AAP6JF38_9GAMM|nr:FGGY family carbohydrate kinase [Gammaproteobacteria bacterium AB-CW1]